MNKKRFHKPLCLLVWFILYTPLMTKAQQKDPTQVAGSTLTVPKHNVSLQIGLLNMSALYQIRTGNQQLFETGIGYGTSLLVWNELVEEYDGPTQRIRGPKGMSIPDIYHSVFYFAGYRYYFHLWTNKEGSSLKNNKSNYGIYAGIKLRGTGPLRIKDDLYQPLYSGNVHLGLQWGWGRKSQYYLNFQAGPGIQYNQNFTRYSIVPAGAILLGINLYQQN